MKYSEKILSNGTAFVLLILIFFLDAYFHVTTTQKEEFHSYSEADHFSTFLSAKEHCLSYFFIDLFETENKTEEKEDDEDSDEIAKNCKKYIYIFPNALNNYGIHKRPLVCTNAFGYYLSDNSPPSFCFTS